MCVYVFKAEDLAVDNLVSGEDRFPFSWQSLPAGNSSSEGGALRCLHLYWCNHYVGLLQSMRLRFQGCSSCLVLYKKHYFAADVLVVQLLQSLHPFFNNVSRALSVEVTFYIYQLGLHLSDLLHLNQLLIS